MISSISGASNLRHPPRILFEDLLRQALQEDLGRAGDLTSDLIVPPDTSSTAAFVARQAGRIAGLEIALEVVRLLDPEIQAEVQIGDGQDTDAGGTLAVVEGNTRSLLSAERVALNLLGRLSGIATATQQLVQAIAHTHARIVCTRKTTPGLRALEKYAVRAGGGTNHRFGLDDAVLIKDNHCVFAGGLQAAVERTRTAAGHLVKIEVEVDSLEQLDQALELGVDAVLLDNMAPAHLQEAVHRTRGRVVLEASGGITPETAARIAETGVDLLSVGWLTHSAPALDVGLDFRRTDD